MSGKLTLTLSGSAYEIPVTMDMKLALKSASEGTFTLSNITFTVKDKKDHMDGPFSGEIRNYADATFESDVEAELIIFDIPVPVTVHTKNTHSTDFSSLTSTLGFTINNNFKDLIKDPKAELVSQ